tara:strand:+ start:242 stop:658 length:417 start_codon:yes stop_codon:yes gene_type:complete
MSYKILSKFVKDISFEIPNVEAYALLEKEISKYNLNFDIKSRPFKNNIIEINTILRLLPTKGVKHKMLAEINYSTLISLEAKVEKKDLEKIVLISIPTEVYPTIYEIFVYLFSQAGMKNVSITKEVNFEKMYNEKNKN